MLKEMTTRIIEGKDLSVQQTEECIREIMGGQASAVSIAAFLTGLHMKGETVEEITGGVQAMRQLALAFPISQGSALDTCGTGGDGKNTFNVSTASAFVAAAAGVQVIKHGNRSASGKTGSADVLEELGIDLQQTPGQGANLLEETGLVFLYAPIYHQAMKYAAPIRKELGFRTIFNVLGPLANPGEIDSQLLGVYRRELLPVMAQAMVALGRKRALVVHGLEGLDEISISGETAVFEVRDGCITERILRPEDLGLNRHPLQEVTGGDARENANLIERLLSGQQTGAPLDFLLINAGAAIYAGGNADTLDEGVDQAKQAIGEGRALRLLETYRSLVRKGRKRCT